MLVAIHTLLLILFNTVTMIVDKSYTITNICTSYVLYLYFCFYPDENAEHHVGAENPPPPTTANSEPLVEDKQETETQNTLAPELASATEVHSPLIKEEQSPPSLPPDTASATPPPEAIDQAEDKVSDTVDAPVVPSSPLTKKEAPVKAEELDSIPDEKETEKDEKKMEEMKKLEEDVVSATVEVAVEDTAIVIPVDTANEETTAEQLETETSELPPTEQEPAAPQNQSATLNSEPETESISVETPELPLANGLPRETEELPDLSCSDTTPLDTPDNTHSQEPAPVADIATQEETETVTEEENLKPCKDDPPTTDGSPAEESTTMQCKMELIYICNSDI